MEISNVYYDNELNDRITQRNRSHVNTNIHLGVRPLSTKYDYKPILDKPLSKNVPIQKYPEFNVQRQFLPGDRPGPWDGFATHVHDESVLRNMFFANTKAPQRDYVPSSKSDLYETRSVPNTKPVKQTHPLLFKIPSQVKTTTKYAHKEKSIFYNDTRQMILNDRL